MSEIRELAMLAYRCAKDISISFRNRNYDADIYALFVAGVREGMMRAAEVCKARATIPQEDIQSYMESGNSGDIASAASDSESHGCANAIRAEADKLEGK